MTTITAADIADLVNTTLPELGEARFTDHALASQKYVMMPQLMRTELEMFQSGKRIDFNYRYTHSGAAKQVGMWEQNTLNIGDTFVQASVPWRHTETSYGWERREFLMNSGERQIVNLIEARRTDGKASLVEHCETQGWSKPEDSSDKLDVFGIPYWIVKDTTEGFKGGDPSGFSGGAAGLPVATYPRAQNWTAQYAAITSADFLAKARKMADYTFFMNPVEEVVEYGAKMPRRGFYTNYDVYSALEDLLRSQNDNLGDQLDKFDGRVRFRQIKVTWVPHLDDDTDDPFYQIDWEVFYPVFLEGDYFAESPAEALRETRRNVIYVAVDLTWNMVCYDRRHNGVLIGGG